MKGVVLRPGKGGWVAVAIGGLGRGVEEGWL